MSTPICDFVHRYCGSAPARFHMPGHKGNGFLGIESLDITEIDGADELFAAHGIIAESEAQASELFGAYTIYSAGGSTLCIQTMLHLTALYAAANGAHPRILAARNAHRAFINSAALLDIHVEWLYPESADNTYVSCPISAEQVEYALQAAEQPFTAVYLTSPDYLGNMLDIDTIAAVCHRNGVLLLVDNAHGAYLKFLPHSLHPIDKGADICCDSAHKTLGVITGGAYLHISSDTQPMLRQHAKASMALFGSSSPSYLILQSLDAANDRMENFRRALTAFLPTASALKRRLSDYGFLLAGDEPLKVTLLPKSFGYTGTEIAAFLEQNRLFPEFHDPDCVVLMLSPNNREADITRLEAVLCSMVRRAALTAKPPSVPHPKRILMPRQAMLAGSELLPVEQCVGRISAAAALSCPPAIPLAVCGEQIDTQTVNCLRYYGITHCPVIKPSAEMQQTGTENHNRS